MKKFLILVVCLLMFMTGCGQSGKNAVKKLNVDFEKFELPLSDDAYDEIRGKIIQVIDFKVGDYNKILVDNDGNVYLYELNAIRDEGKLKKVNDNLKIPYIDSVIQALDESIDGYDMLLINSNGKYYSLPTESEDMVIKEYSTIDDKNKYFSYKKYSKPSKILISVIQGISDSGQIIYYQDNGKDVPNKKTYIGVDSDSSEIKAKYYKDKIYLSEKGELYDASASIFLNSELNVYELKNKDLILDNIENFWEFSDDFEASYIFCQTKDNTLYLYRNEYNLSEEFKNPLGEKVEKIFFASKDALVVGEKNVYYFDWARDYEPKKLDNLNKYKDEIRGFIFYNDSLNVLLSDGQFYKT